MTKNKHWLKSSFLSTCHGKKLQGLTSGKDAVEAYVILKERKGDKEAVELALDHAPEMMQWWHDKFVAKQPKRKPQFVVGVLPEDNSLEDQTDQACLEAINPILREELDFELTMFGYRAIKKFFELPDEDIYQAMEITRRKNLEEPDNRCRYLCGVLKNMLRNKGSSDFVVS